MEFLRTAADMNDQVRTLLTITGRVLDLEGLLEELTDAQALVPASILDSTNTGPGERPGVITHE